MILSCDPPRHAFLIHFGKRLQPHPLQTFKTECLGARAELALNLHSTPPSLVAVHFVRHGFRLPFVGSKDQSAIRQFHIQSGHRQDRFHFYFSYEPRNCKEWHLYPGFTALLSEPSHFNADLSQTVEKRPALEGFFVDTKILKLDIDMSEFAFECGADNLKDVPVTLFVER